MNSVKLHHTFQDLADVRRGVSDAKILVRINPMYEGTAQEIESAIQHGADAIMLPMWKKKEEVDRFVQMVHGCCETFLFVMDQFGRRNPVVFANRCFLCMECDIIKKSRNLPLSTQIMPCMHPPISKTISIHPVCCLCKTGWTGVANNGYKMRGIAIAVKRLFINRHIANCKNSRIVYVRFWNGKIMRENYG